MFERIVVPTDGSEYAAAAAADAIALAAVHGATIHAVSVVDAGALGDLQLPGESARASDVLGEQAQTFVEEIEARAVAESVEVKTVVRSGPPGSEILDYAEEVDADLVVMGTRGHGGLHRLAVGSVTDHVIRFGDVRVLVVDAGADDERES